MAKRNIRCILLVMLTVILAIGALNGCGRKNPEENENGAGGSGASKGRYVEEEIKLPLKEGERAINLSKSREGNPVLFAAAGDAKIRRCEYIDGEWEEKNLEKRTGFVRERPSSHVRTGQCLPSMSRPVC